MPRSSAKLVLALAATVALWGATRASAGGICIDNPPNALVWQGMAVPQSEKLTYDAVDGFEWVGVLSPEVQPLVVALGRDHVLAVIDAQRATVLLRQTLDSGSGLQLADGVRALPTHVAGWWFVLYDASAVWLVSAPTDPNDGRPRRAAAVRRFGDAFRPEKYADDPESLPRLELVAWHGPNLVAVRRTGAALLFDPLRGQVLERRTFEPISRAVYCGDGEHGALLWQAGGTAWLLPLGAGPKALTAAEPIDVGPTLPERVATTRAGWVLWWTDRLEMREWDGKLHGRVALDPPVQTAYSTLVDDFESSRARPMHPQPTTASSHATAFGGFVAVHTDKRVRAHDLDTGIVMWDRPVSDAFGPIIGFAGSHDAVYVPHRRAVEVWATRPTSTTHGPWEDRSWSAFVESGVPTELRWPGIIGGRTYFLFGEQASDAWEWSCRSTGPPGIQGSSASGSLLAGIAPVDAQWFARGLLVIEDKRLRLFEISLPNNPEKPK